MGERKEIEINENIPLYEKFENYEEDKKQFYSTKYRYLIKKYGIINIIAFIIMLIIIIILIIIMYLIHYIDKSKWNNIKPSTLISILTVIIRTIYGYIVTNSLLQNIWRNMILRGLTPNEIISNQALANGLFGLLYIKKANKPHAIMAIYSMLILAIGPILQSAINDRQVELCQNDDIIINSANFTNEVWYGSGGFGYFTNEFPIITKSINKQVSNINNDYQNVKKNIECSGIKCITQPIWQLNTYMSCSVNTNITKLNSTDFYNAYELDDSRSLGYNAGVALIAISYLDEIGDSIYNLCRIGVVNTTFILEKNYNTIITNILKNEIFNLTSIQNSKDWNTQLNLQAIINGLIKLIVGHVHTSVSGGLYVDGNSLLYSNKVTSTSAFWNKNTTVILSKLVNDTINQILEDYDKKINIQNNLICYFNDYYDVTLWKVIIVIIYLFSSLILFTLLDLISLKIIGVRRGNSIISIITISSDSNMLNGFCLADEKIIAKYNNNPIFLGDSSIEKDNVRHCSLLNKKSLLIDNKYYE